VVSRRLVDDEDDEDANTILRVSSILRYSPGTELIVALCKSHNADHAVAAGAMSHHIVCFREMRLKMLARAVRYLRIAVRRAGN
jgi:hypothetical protein